MGSTTQAKQGGASPAKPEKDLHSDPATLAETLDQLLSSKTFSRSGQLKRLLGYLRDTLDCKDPSVWSETSFGVHAFGRKDFDPRLDTIVRVEMRRLRQKLDEYYAHEGSDCPFRLRFEKNTYRPYVEPNIPPALEPNAPVTVVPATRFWEGVFWGAGAMALVAAAIGVIWWAATGATSRAPREVAESPIWAGFGSTSVVVGIGTPLFFRSSDGFERNFNENFPEDLRLADQLLLHKPAFPVWNLWATFDDVGAVVGLDRFLRTLNSTSSVVSARQLSFGGLTGKRTIILGQPRGAPLLVELLAGENFHTRAHVAGEQFSGFVNAQPKPGEPDFFPGGKGTLLMQSDESNPDYALVTRIRGANGEEVLNVFGDRVQSGAYIIRKLMEPSFLAELDGRIFDSARPDFQSAQVVLRVDYSRSVPTGLVYLAHRVKRAQHK